MWSGWSREAAELQRTAYRLTKMRNRFLLQGEATEKAVMWVLRQKQNGIDVKPDEAYSKVAKPFLIESWKDSKRGRWKENPKKYCCLHEHYYENLNKDRTREDQLVTDVANTVRLCITNFIKLVLPRLEGIRQDQEIPVKTIESGDPESFELNGIKVYAIPDYVYSAEETCHIYDWKSGKLEERHQDQVALYGLWASSSHNVFPDKIRVHLEYLKECQSQSQDLSEEILNTVRKTIVVSAQQMAEYLVDGDIGRNEPVPKEEWPMSADEKVCEHCNFWELCEPDLAQ